MPCYDPRDDPRRRSDDEPAGNSRYTSYIEARLDKVTALLCYTMRSVGPLELHNLLIKNPELKEWWEEHKAFDKKRKKKK